MKKPERIEYSDLVGRGIYTDIIVIATVIIFVLWAIWFAARHHVVY